MLSIEMLHVDRIEVASNWEGVSYIYIRISSIAMVKSCECDKKSALSMENYKFKLFKKACLLSAILIESTVAI